MPSPTVMSFWMLQSHVRHFVMTLLASLLTLMVANFDLIQAPIVSLLMMIISSQTSLSPTHLLRVLVVIKSVSQVEAFYPLPLNLMTGLLISLPNSCLCLYLLVRKIYCLLNCPSNTWSSAHIISNCLSKMTPPTGSELRCNIYLYYCYSLVDEISYTFGIRVEYI